MVPMAFNQDVKAAMPAAGLDADYLLYALLQHKAHLTREIGTSAHGTRRLGTSALENFRIPMIAVHDQTRIADALQALDRKLQVEQNRSQALRVLFGTVLRALMKGILRTDLPADANWLVHVVDGPTECRDG
jgi:restriction endonuclease S subunit